MGVFLVIVNSVTKFLIWSDSYAPLITIMFCGATGAILMGILWTIVEHNDFSTESGKNQLDAGRE